MNIFKPTPNETVCTLYSDDDFYKYTHLDGTRGDYTLCGVGSEEWKDELPLKRVTCPDCLDIINLCIKYKKL